MRKTKSKGRAKTIKGGHVGTYIKRFEEWLSSYLGGIKVTCISSKISGVDPTLEELERVGRGRFVHPPGRCAGPHM